MPTMTSTRSVMTALATSTPAAKIRQRSPSERARRAMLSRRRHEAAGDAGEQHAYRRSGKTDRHVAGKR
jgi:hypothetical protein